MTFASDAQRGWYFANGHGVASGSSPTFPHVPDTFRPTPMPPSFGWEEEIGLATKVSLRIQANEESLVDRDADFREAERHRRFKYITEDDRLSFEEKGKLLKYSEAFKPLDRT